jgi:hypothetical protein
MSKEDQFAKLMALEAEAVAMGKQIRNEATVARQELADRQRKGLTGDAAIAHYNEWMQRYGMEHLMVREGVSL